jgi:hypothetical protein
VIVFAGEQRIGFELADVGIEASQFLAQIFQ